ncbi:hypothetical protein B0H14DRAFT_3508436 [Mycena olivaceomarginata]|nr:hypothetical protein B0H14DRAFT_3508436 [Mycena olivaceomarginata]
MYVPVPYALFSLTKCIPGNLVHPTPPFPSVPGWTFRRWPPPRQIDLDRVTAILFFETFTHQILPAVPDGRLSAGSRPANFTVAQRRRFPSLRNFAHFNPPFSQAFRIDVRTLDAAAPNSPCQSRNYFSAPPLIAHAPTPVPSHLHIAAAPCPRTRHPGAAPNRLRPLRLPPRCLSPAFEPPISVSTCPSRSPSIPPTPLPCT